MIDPHVQFEGFDARSWSHLLTLFAPGLAEHHEGPVGEGPRGVLWIVVSDRGEVRSAFHTLSGPVRGLTSASPTHLRELAQEHGARRALLVCEGAFEELAERMAVRPELSEPYLAQALALLEIFRELLNDGLVHMWPRPFSQLPVPSASSVLRTADLVLPGQRCLLLALWEGESVWTAVALRRSKDAIDRIVGPDRLCRWTGPLGGDWRRDYRLLIEAATEHIAPVHLGVFAERATFEGLVRDSTAGAWSSAIAVRDVVVSPAPASIAVALAADASHALAKQSARWVSNLDFAQTLAPLANALRETVGAAASLTATLGFNPLTAFATYLNSRSPSPADTHCASAQSAPEEPP